MRTLWIVAAGVLAVSLFSLPGRSRLARRALSGRVLATGERLGAARGTATPEGTSSTPAAFDLPQLGRFRFRCNSAFAVQPTFTPRGAPSEDTVIMRAGAFVARNYVQKVVGRVHGRPLIEIRFTHPSAPVTLPFAHYRLVTVTVRQATEARELVARLSVRLVAGRFRRAGVRGLLGACFASQVSSVLDIRPY